MALFFGIHEKYAIWKFIIYVVHDFVSSLQPDVDRGFLHVSKVFLFILYLIAFFQIAYLILMILVGGFFCLMRWMPILQ